MKIPKIIHQIWIGPREPPWPWIKTWQSMNPDWKYMLWREGDFALSNQKQYNLCSTYSGRTNIMRYEILSSWGGVYLDADLEPRRQLKELVGFFDCQNSDFFAVYRDENNQPGKLSNAAIGCTASHPIMAEMVRHIEKISDVDIMNQPTLSTGHYPFTRFCDDSTSKVDRLPSHSFLPLHHSGRMCTPEQWDEAIAIHHWHSTLHPNSNQVKKEN